MFVRIVDRITPARIRSRPAGTASTNRTGKAYYDRTSARQVRSPTRIARRITTSARRCSLQASRGADFFTTLILSFAVFFCKNVAQPSAAAHDINPLPARNEYC